ncbi:putative biogenesis of lysosome-related organelles complex 1 subunit KXD1 [[Candida] jaroonii]|uniref:Biogenesis of lysosome-related organelles complex 1 subunit KXD1 n=1 Tax=[Candida] jaroonii TaxID=467808 RepID=A0ACA9YDW5_9ASCO|nr:putative biogenesis of lysosome-related organelles complex 1 subunit KXD1 [[Candida] jaroonii]
MVRERTEVGTSDNELVAADAAATDSDMVAFSTEVEGSNDMDRSTARSTEPSTEPFSDPSLDTSNTTNPNNTTTTTSDSQDHPDSDSDSSYLLSDTEERLTYNAVPDTQYLTSTLSHGLDSMELDKSLVLQTKLSGYLNNENQKINEKRQLVIQKLQSLKSLHSANFKPNGGVSKVEQLTNDIKDIESRIRNIKHGNTTLLGLFRSQSGLVNKYPVEYNQARDKVLERPWDQ